MSSTRADIEVCAGRSGWLEPVGVSVPGGAHLEHGMEGQDAWRVGRRLDRGALCLVVADGASSRARSAEGAHLAAGVAADILPRYLGRVPATESDWKDLLQRSMGLICDRFLRVTAGMTTDGDPSPFATTLTFAVLAGAWVGFASVGDCFAVARIAAGDGHRLKLALEPPPPAGEYANETTFLTSADAMDEARFRVTYAPELDGLALCSDGCTEFGLFYEGREPSRPHGAFFDQVFASTEGGREGPADLLRYLCSGQVAASSGDDKTVVAVARGA